MSGDIVVDATLVCVAVTVAACGYVIFSLTFKEWYADWKESRRVRDRKDALIALMYHQLETTGRALGLSDKTITSTWNEEDRATIRKCLAKQLAPTGYNCFKFI